MSDKITKAKGTTRKEEKKKLGIVCHYVHTCDYSLDGELTYCNTRKSVSIETTGQELVRAHLSSNSSTPEFEHEVQLDDTKTRIERPFGRHTSVRGNTPPCPCIQHDSECEMACRERGIFEALCSILETQLTVLLLLIDEQMRRRTDCVVLGNDATSDQLNKRYVEDKLDRLPITPFVPSRCPSLSRRDCPSPVPDTFRVLENAQFKGHDDYGWHNQAVRRGSKAE